MTAWHFPRYFPGERFFFHYILSEPYIHSEHFIRYYFSDLLGLRLGWPLQNIDFALDLQRNGPESLQICSLNLSSITRNDSMPDVDIPGKY